MDSPGALLVDRQSGFQIPEYILVDLCSRFIINIPEEERQDLIRVFFQIELAHWFYLDFYCQENADLRACGIKDFSAQIFQHCPTLIEHADNVQKILESWRGYKMAVPTYGAIILDPTLKYCLLVQGYYSKASWGFPKGKVNEDELPHDCAIREVLEETGFDISHIIDKDEYIEFKMNEQPNRLYLIPGVSMDTMFQTRTRKEIKQIKWFEMEYLPEGKKDTACKEHFSLPPNAFFMVIPFVRSLKKWINRQTGRPDPEDSTVKSGRKSQNREPVTDSAGRQKLRPQQLFKAHLHTKTEPIIKGKSLKVQADSPSGKNARKQSTSPKVKGRASPKSTKKGVQILKRDGTLSGNTPKRGTSSQFADGNTGEKDPSPRTKRHSRKEEFFSHAWANFKLDIDAAMAVF